MYSISPANPWVVVSRCGRVFSWYSMRVGVCTWVLNDI